MGSGSCFLPQTRLCSSAEPNLGSSPPVVRKTDKQSTRKHRSCCFGIYSRPPQKAGCGITPFFNAGRFRTRRLGRKLPVDPVYIESVAVYLPRRNTALRHSFVWVPLRPDAERSTSRTPANQVVCCFPSSRVSFSPLYKCGRVHVKKSCF